MDPLHRQVILDCYDDIRRDMDPTLILRYGTINWRDGDPGLIKGKARNDGKYYGATVLLEKLLDLPYDGFEDFIQSLQEASYGHLVKQLQETRVRLLTAVENGQIRRRDLGRRRQDITRRSRRIQGAVGLLLMIGLAICAWTLTAPSETASMAAFPRRLKTFVGRENVFSKIDACLKQNQTCLIKGLGGIGKTTLAIEYGHKRADRYPGGVFWVSLASTRDMCASISQYIPYFNEKGEVSVLSNNHMNCTFMKTHFKRYLTNSQYWLLVVDEAVRETMEELESLIPHTLTPAMNILLTSQEYQRLDMSRISVVNLGRFSDEEAQAMFDKTVRPSSEDDRRVIERLSRSLGLHPLALQFAYAYITATSCSVKEYLEKYIGGNATDRIDLLDKANIEQFTNKRIRRAFDITFQYVSQLSINAAELLNMTSFTGPDCIPCPEPNSQGFANLFTTSGKLDKFNKMEMITVLERFSVASHCDRLQLCAFSVNRIVQEVVVPEMKESSRLIHMENALKYLTLLLRQGKDISRVQAESLMAHVHYSALNVDRYQMTVSLTASSTFFNTSADFFCQWGACEEAYFFVQVQSLLFFKHNSTQKLPCLLLDNVNFLWNTLLPCLYDGDVPIQLFVDIADNLYLVAVDLESMFFSSNSLASCDIDQAISSAFDASCIIYKRLLQSRKLENIDYSNLPGSFFHCTSTYIEESSFENLEKLFIPNPTITTDPAAYWDGLYSLVSFAGRLLHPEGLYPLRVNADFKKLPQYLKMHRCDVVNCNCEKENRKFSIDFELCHNVKKDIIDFKCDEVKCAHETIGMRTEVCCFLNQMLESLSLLNMCNGAIFTSKTKDNKQWHCFICCAMIDESRELLQRYRSNIQKAIKVVNKVLFMFYHAMVKSTCTNRYFEVMLGLPRESKEFDILDFAREDWHDLFGDPGVVKSVLSLTNTLNPKFQKRGKNPQTFSVSPSSYFTFYSEVQMKYQLTVMAQRIWKTVDETTLQSKPSPVEDCSVLSEAVALLEKGQKWKELNDKWLLKSIKELLDGCHRQQSFITNNNIIIDTDLLVESYSEQLKALNATVFEADTLLDWFEYSSPSNASEVIETFRRLLVSQKKHYSLSNSIKDEANKIMSSTRKILGKCFLGDGEIIPLSLCRDFLETISGTLGSLRHSLSLGLIRAKKQRKAEKGIKNVHPATQYLRNLTKLVKNLDGNPFVKGDCLCACPSLRSVFHCESSFPFVLWFSIRLQEMLKHLECSLEHENLNITCFSYFMETLDMYLSNSKIIDFKSLQNEGTVLGQPLSDGGENFHFVIEDDKVIGVAHKIGKFSIKTVGLPVFEQDIRISRKGNKKTRS